MPSLKPGQAYVDDPCFGVTPNPTLGATDEAGDEGFDLGFVTSVVLLGEFLDGE